MPVPQPLILEQLRELGIDISAGQVNRLLIEHKEAFHEQQEVLQAGLETAGMCIRMTLARATKDRMGCTVIVPPVYLLPQHPE